MQQAKNEKEPAERQQQQQEARQDAAAVLANIVEELDLEDLIYLQTGQPQRTQHTQGEEKEEEEEETTSTSDTATTNATQRQRHRDRRRRRRRAQKKHGQRKTSQQRHHATANGAHAHTTEDASHTHPITDDEDESEFAQSSRGISNSSSDDGRSSGEHVAGRRRLHRQQPVRRAPASSSTPNTISALSPNQNKNYNNRKTADDDILSFHSLRMRADALHDRGKMKKAAHFYLFCVERFQTAQPGVDGVDPAEMGHVLRRLREICYAQKKYKEALQFGHAEKLVYESRLLSVLQAVKRQQEPGLPGVIGADAAGSRLKSGTRSSPSSSMGVLSKVKYDGVAAAIGEESVDPTIQRLAMLGNTATAGRNRRHGHGGGASDGAMAHAGNLSGGVPKEIALQEQRALSYERLARAFFIEGNDVMAKSYIQKAVTIRKRLKAEWGDPARLTDDELLVRRFAQVGKRQYASTLKQYRKQGGGKGSDGADAAEEAAVFGIGPDAAAAAGKNSGEVNKEEQGAIVGDRQQKPSGRLKLKPVESSSAQRKMDKLKRADTAAIDDFMNFLKGDGNGDRHIYFTRSKWVMTIAIGLIGILFGALVFTR